MTMTAPPTTCVSLLSSEIPETTGRPCSAHSHTLDCYSSRRSGLCITSIVAPRLVHRVVCPGRKVKSENYQ